MATKKKTEMEFRYYEIPQGEQVLALLGEDWVRPYGEDIDSLHFHNLMEVGYCIYGEGTLVMDESVVPYEPGMLTVIPVNYPHTTISKSNTKSSWEYLFLDPEEILRTAYPDDEQFVRRILDKLNQKAGLFYQGENPECEQIVRLIMEECRHKKSYSIEANRGLLLAMLMVVARKDASQETSVSHNTKSGIQQLEPALSYIESHYMDDFCMEDLAKQCHLSETHFRRLFMQYMNMTPVEYVTLVRIRHACNMMKKTRYSMEEIAERVGYSAVSTFNRNFRKILGTSPYQYKKNSANYEGKLLNYHVSAKKGW